MSPDYLRSMFPDEPRPGRMGTPYGMSPRFESPRMIACAGCGKRVEADPTVVCEFHDTTGYIYPPEICDECATVKIDGLVACPKCREDLENE